MSDLTAALHARRADLHATIRLHADEIADIDRLLVRHDPEFQPTPVLAAVPFSSIFGLLDEDFDVDAALRNDDRPPADVPHVEPATVAEDRVEHAPDVLPGPPSPATTIPVTPAGADLVAATTAATPSRRSPRPSERGEPSIRCQHPGCDRVFATNQAHGAHVGRAHPAATDTTPGAPWDYAEVARVARSAHDAGESMTTAVQGLRPGCKVSAAQMAISTARKKGHDIPNGRTSAPTPLPARKPSPKSPVEQPAEGGRVVRCSDCGWQTGPSNARDLLKHCLIEHGREPTKAERTPIIDERAA
jgi:hypothetical protein